MSVIATRWIVCCDRCGVAIGDPFDSRIDALDVAHACSSICEKCDVELQQQMEEEAR